MDRYNSAKQMYQEIGVDVEAALDRLKKVPISIHCWQGDDVTGFENMGQKLSGGIQATGNYPGKARTVSELMQDFKKAISMIPGSKRINLHASYAIRQPGDQADRDQLRPEHFDQWIKFAQENGIGIDFNPTFFSHPMVQGGLTLSSPDENVRKFWVRHAIACRRIASYISSKLKDPVLHNIWIPDGLKDLPADRLGPRLRLKQSLDEIFAEKVDGVIDCVESKVFGIGAESYTVGSSEFYTAYAATHPGVYNLMDNGHYHPTEKVSDKIPAMLAFFDKLPLHVTRAVRWDSDHVVLFDDDTKEIAVELVRCDALEKAIIGLDFFDASINRVSAWVVGTRNMQKALLYALLMPHDTLREMQQKGQFTELMAMQEEIKSYPFGDIWKQYCKIQQVSSGIEWIKEVKKYETDVLSKRS